MNAMKITLAMRKYANVLGRTGGTTKNTQIMEQKEAGK